MTDAQTMDFPENAPMIGTQDWRQIRPYRNLSPGDLRTLPLGQHWFGQIGTDTASGGPFARFGREQDGWRALATCLRTYQDVHGLRTIRTIVGRFAPPIENNTAAYIQGMCDHVHVKADDTISIHATGVLDAICAGIALMEGGARIVWSATERAAGVAAALGA